MTNEENATTNSQNTEDETQSAKKRGGARPNSGRPPLPAEERPWRLSVGLKKENRDLLKTMAQKRHLSMAKMLNLLIQQQAENDIRQAELEQGLPKSNPTEFEGNPLD